MAGSTNIVPAARLDHLVMSHVGDEVLVYDQHSHHIHHLNPSCAAVWQACDGQRTVSELATATGLAEEHVQLALTKLAEASLLDGEVTVDDPLHSRRRFLTRASVVGAIPTIVSVTAPAAARAQSLAGVCEVISDVDCVCVMTSGQFCFDDAACGGSNPSTCIEGTACSCA